MPLPHRIILNQFWWGRNVRHFWYHLIILSCLYFQTAKRMVLYALKKITLDPYLISNSIVGEFQCICHNYLKTQKKRFEIQITDCLAGAKDLLVTYSCMIKVVGLCHLIYLTKLKIRLESRILLAVLQNKGLTYSVPSSYCIHISPCFTWL